MNGVWNSRVRLGVALLGAAMLSACTSTSRLEDAEVNGFLQDYSMLRPGEEGQAQLVYVRRGVNWASYDKILLEPIRAYGTKNQALTELPKDELKALVDYLDASLRAELGQDYQLVTEAGPGVLRLRVAISAAEAGKPVKGVMSSVMPPGLALSLLKTGITGTGVGTGTARVEMELQDSETKQRLAAAVDAQSGNKRDFFGSFSKWDDAQDAFDGWSRNLRTRLQEWRSSGV